MLQEKSRFGSLKIYILLPYYWKLKIMIGDIDN